MRLWVADKYKSLLHGSRAMLNLSWQCECGCYCMWMSCCCLRELDIACSLCVLATSVLGFCPWYSLLCCVDDGPLYSGALVLSWSSRSINAPVVIKEWESMLLRLEQLAQDIRKEARCPPLLHYVTYRKCLMRMWYVQTRAPIGWQRFAKSKSLFDFCQHAIDLQQVDALPDNNSEIPNQKEEVLCGLNGWIWSNKCDVFFSAGYVSFGYWYGRVWNYCKWGARDVN